MQAAHRRAQEGRGRNPSDRPRGLEPSSKKFLLGVSSSTGSPLRITGTGGETLLDRSCEWCGDEPNPWNCSQCRIYR